ncbi:hypothetical protein [Actinocorallia populi]|uniref:hypothetical protein n=1 Tax=Actinocorallia populi TaxID=2079200 RepID=UPI000D0967AB|nr:hypothetical protein [Actinocorallia populi]
MGVTEADRALTTGGHRPRAARVIGGRPWRDPVLDRACDAVRERYLRVAVSALRETRTDAELRSLRVEYLAKAAAGLSRGIEALLAHDPYNPDLHLWLGRTLIEEAWRIRPTARSRSQQAWGYQAFARALQGAREPLKTAAELCPDDPVPWESMQWLALGLETDAADKEALWRRAVERWPTLYGAHVARIISLSPQWGGVAEEMFDFARVAMSMSSREDPRAALIPLAYFEYFVQERSGLIKGSSSWFSEAEIRDVEAAARGWHEGHRPHPRTLEAHNLFGAAFHLGDARRPARNHLLRTLGRPSSLPWSYLGGGEVEQYVKACKHLNIIGH